jgi:glycosyltransferase involved in cell wall biosynthesis
VGHKFLFIDNNNIGYGLSGGDTIFIQLLKNWQNSNQITFLACQEAINILPSSINKLNIITTDSVNPNPSNSLINLFFHYLRRIYKVFLSISRNKSLLQDNEFVYSVSDFLPDLLPTLFLKISKPKIKWMAGYYLFAPNPFSKTSPYHGIHRLKGFIYWFIQLFTKSIVNHFADYILITSSPDITRFSKNKHVIVIRGGVDLIEINNYIKAHPLKLPPQRQYDACFLGRFHPQKGCLKLIAIWKNVTNKLPNAKLAIIGQGEMENQMRQMISKYKLQKNIDIFDFLVGTPKYQIFADSKIVVHPATYDSGGMASAEAMAFGLPGISFDLESLRSYYPKGFLKSKCFSTTDFANNIVKLLTNKTIYHTLSEESLKLIKTNWNWIKRAKEIYSSIVYNQP